MTHTKPRIFKAYCKNCKQKASKTSRKFNIRKEGTDTVYDKEIVCNECGHVIQHFGVYEFGGDWPFHLPDRAGEER